MNSRKLSLSALVEKWREEQKTYPKTDMGDAAAAAVRCCARELEVALAASGSEQSDGKCIYCGGIGHKPEDCATPCDYDPMDGTEDAVTWQRKLRAQPPALPSREEIAKAICNAHAHPVHLEYRTGPCYGGEKGADAVLALFGGAER